METESSRGLLTKSLDVLIDATTKTAAEIELEGREGSSLDLVQHKVERKIGKGTRRMICVYIRPPGKPILNSLIGVELYNTYYIERHNPDELKDILDNQFKKQGLLGYEPHEPILGSNIPLTKLYKFPFSMKRDVFGCVSSLIS